MSSAGFLYSQDYGNVILPGAPEPFRPVWGEWDGHKRIIRIGENDITLQNVKLDKPSFGRDWIISFDLDNHTGRELENVEFCFVFFSQEKTLLSTPFNMGKFSFDRIGMSDIRIHKSMTVAKSLWPEDYKKASLVGIGLSSIIAKKTKFERMDEEAAEKRKREDDRKILMDIAQIKAQKENDEKEADNRKLDEAIKKREDQKNKAVAVAKKKREEAISRQRKEIQDLIRQRKIRIGMNHEQVVLSWGRPEHINTTTYASGTHEQWVFNSRSYVYFENGILTAIQN
jgi:hypothetical protein